MINKIFVCLENYTYGIKGESNNCIFIKGELYNVIIDYDYDIEKVKITDNNGNWIRFHKNINDDILNRFIELKELRKEKIKKLNEKM